MKSFREFIQEQTADVPGLCLSRDQMPQIDNIDDFIDFVGSHGFVFSSEFDYVDHLRPTQHSFDQTKVDSIINGKPSKPIIVSSDQFILDGHHRYFAAKQSGQKIKWVEFAVPIIDLLKLADDYLSI